MAASFGPSPTLLLRQPFTQVPPLLISFSLLLLILYVHVIFIHFYFHFHTSNLSNMHAVLYVFECIIEGYIFVDVSFLEAPVQVSLDAGASPDSQIQLKYN